MCLQKKERKSGKKSVKFFQFLFLFFFSLLIFQLVKAASCEYCPAEKQVQENLLGALKQELKNAIVPCGRKCDDPNTPLNECSACTICHLFIVAQNILDFFKLIIIITGLILLTISAVIFIVSFNKPSLVTLAKEITKKTLVGFLVFFLAWVIVLTTLKFFSANETSLGTGGKWYQFTCDTTSHFDSNNGNNQDNQEEEKILVVEPEIVSFMQVGETQQLKVTFNKKAAGESDKEEIIDVTNESNYSIIDSSIAEVSSTGLVTNKISVSAEEMQKQTKIIVQYKQYSTTVLVVVVFNGCYVKADQPSQIEIGSTEKNEKENLFSFKKALANSPVLASKPAPDTVNIEEYKTEELLVVSFCVTEGNEVLKNQDVSQLGFYLEKKSNQNDFTTFNIISSSVRVVEESIIDLNTGQQKNLAHYLVTFNLQKIILYNKITSSVTYVKISDIEEGEYFLNYSLKKKNGSVVAGKIMSVEDPSKQRSILFKKSYSGASNCEFIKIKGDFRIVFVVMNDIEQWKPEITDPEKKKEMAFEIIKTKYANLSIPPVDYNNYSTFLSKVIGKNDCYAAFPDALVVNVFFVTESGDSYGETTIPSQKITLFHKTIENFLVPQIGEIGYIIVLSHEMGHAHGMLYDEYALCNSSDPSNIGGCEVSPFSSIPGIQPNCFRINESSLSGTTPTEKSKSGEKQACIFFDSINKNYFAGDPNDPGYCEKSSVVNRCNLIEGYDKNKDYWYASTPDDIMGLSNSPNKVFNLITKTLYEKKLDEMRGIYH